MYNVRGFGVHPKVKFRPTCELNLKARLKNIAESTRSRGHN